MKERTVIDQKMVDGNDRFHLKDEILRKYEARRHLLEGLAQALHHKTEAMLSGLAHIDRIQFRVKSPKSFFNKAKYHNPPYQNPFVEMHDQVGGRVVVFSEPDLCAVKERLIRGCSRILENSFQRPRSDEEFGYESHHLVCEIPYEAKPPGWDDCQDMPEAFELQLRTLFMHAWAEQQHELVYKGPADLPHDIRRSLASAAALA